MKADRQLTEQRQFVERKSYVAADGREVLYKLDWKRRVKQLQDRCGGRCEHIFKTAAGEEMRCSRAAAHAHHVVKRSKGRDDRISNLVALCIFHHVEMHPEKQIQGVKR